MLRRRLFLVGPLALVTLCTLAPPAARAATVRLYLKDGTWQPVTEYKVLPDRVRYYSSERGEWEEIPLDMVDLKKTESEVKRLAEERQKTASFEDAEEKAERALRREVERIPFEFGVFYPEGQEMRTVKAAECKIQNNKRRSILKAVAPIPIISGKATVEVEGLQSAFVVKEDRPEMYIRLSADERFTIVKARQTKTARVIQEWEIAPVVKEIIEKQEEVEIFRKQIYDGLYKIWPMKPLEPGEYAVIQYTEGKGQIQVWDFRYEKK